jgi:hypothetical protein
MTKAPIFNVMNTHRQHEKGSTLVCALCIILIMSFIGANVLMNCTTRYNVTSAQVAGWKDALCAAEAGADIAYAETRKALMNPGTQFSGAGWTSSNASTGPWTYTMPNPFGAAGNLSASASVDNFTSVDGYACYRIRSVGTARVFGLRRVGMDDRPTGATSSFVSGSDVRGRGDSLLRKIDFNYDHFISTYGDGDGNNKQQVALPNDGNGNPLAQVSRRVEAIAVPILPVSGAIKTSGSFYGPGSAGVIDSFNSKNGPYNPDVALGGTPLPQYYSDSRDGNVNCGGSSFTSLTGDIYGNVTTDGATLKSTKYITGSVDNNVPVTLQPQAAVSPPPSRQYESTSPITIDPPASNPKCSGQPPDSWANAPWYSYTNLQNVTINPVTVGSTPRETYVNIVVNGDISTSLIINQGVNVRIYFTGNVNIKVSNFSNKNVDGSSLANIDGTSSTNSSASAHVQFYGVSPTAPATQTINLDANGKPSIEALWYAPGADFISKGNIVMYGAVVCKSFYENGDCFFHYDKALGNLISPNDYRIASYIEDVR